MTGTLTPCRSCGSPLAWHFTPSGAKLPLDPVAHPDGNVMLVGPEPGTAVVLTRARVAEERAAGTPLYKSHWSTCKDATPFRKVKP